MNGELAGRAGRRIAKIRRTIASRTATPYLVRRAAHAKGSLVDPTNPVVVSLTSHGDRLTTVHLTIESIARGSARPARLILWIDPHVDADSLPEPLQRQRARGLEVLSSEAGFGPHTKYYPYVCSEESHVFPLVTADDDSIYPRSWLDKLQFVARACPEQIICYRAHRVGLTSDGAIAPYNSWKPVRSTAPSVLNFATGVSGVHYPAEFLSELRADGQRFTECAPRADDVWLHDRAVSHGWVIRQVFRWPRKYPEIASTQAVALHRSNTGQSANDDQIKATYRSDVVRTLVAAVGRG